MAPAGGGRSPVSSRLSLLTKLSRSLLPTRLAVSLAKALVPPRVKPAQEREAHLVLALLCAFCSSFPCQRPIWLLSEAPDKGLVNKHLKSMKAPKRAANQR